MTMDQVTAMMMMIFTKKMSRERQLCLPFNGYSSKLFKTVRKTLNPLSNKLFSGSLNLLKTFFWVCWKIDKIWLQHNLAIIIDTVLKVRLKKKINHGLRARKKKMRGVRMSCCFSRLWIKMKCFSNMRLEIVQRVRLYTPHLYSARTIAL